MKPSSEMRARARAWLNKRAAAAHASMPSIFATAEERERFPEKRRTELEVIDYLAGLVDGGPHGE